MNKLQFLIDWYNREEERKASVENSLNIPIGILTLLFVVQFYLITNFDFVNCKNWEIVSLLIFVTASCLSSLATGFYILKFYHNFPNEYKYGGIPYASQLLKHESELIEFYKQNATHFNNVKGEEKFIEYLQNKLAEHIDKNSFNNDAKYRFLNISKRLILLSVFTLVIAFIPFLTNTFIKPIKYQKEMINLEDLNKRIENIENSLKDNSKQNDNKRKTTTTDTTTSTTGQAN